MPKSVSLQRRNIVFSVAAVWLVASVLAIWGMVAQQRISSDRYDVRQAGLSVDIPIEENARWALGLLNGDQVSVSEVEQRLSSVFLQQVPARDFLISTRLFAAGGPFEQRGFTVDSDAGLQVLQTAVASQDDSVFDLTVSWAPDRIQGMTFLRGTSDRGPLSPIETVSHLVAGWGLAAGGFAVWFSRRRPLAGKLLISAGGFWLLQFLELTDVGVPYTVGLMAGPVGAFLAGLGLIALGPDPFDTGGRVVASIAGLAMVATLSQLLVINTEVAQLPRQFLAITHDRDTAVLLGSLGQATAVIAAISLMGLLWMRHGRDGGVGTSFRQMLAMIGTVIAAIVVPVGVWGLASEHHDLSQSPLMSAAALAIPAGLGAEAIRDSRNAIGGVASMVGEIQSRSDLQASLAQALGDPSVELAFWAPDENRYVSPAGLPVSVEASAVRAVTMLDAGTEPIGAVLHDPALLAEPDRVRAATSAARLALDNARLQALVVAELRSSRTRILQSAEQARRTIERDLHDGAQQRLIALQLSLKLEQQRAARAGEAVDSGYLDSLSDELGDAIDELRELGRGLRPSALDHGLQAALESLAERSPLPIVLNIAADRAPVPFESAAYFVINEAVANATRHSGADHIRVDVTMDESDLRLEIADDGSGGAQKSAGAGLQSLEDRVVALNGSWKLISPPQRGTCIRVTLPLDGSEV